MNKKLLTKYLLIILTTLTLIGIFLPAFADPVKAETSSGTLSGYTVDNNVESAGKDYLFNSTAEEEDGNVVVKNSGLFAAAPDALSAALGVDYVPLEGYKTTAGMPIYIRKQGAVGDVMSLNQQLYDNPPASGIVYAQQQWEQITKGHVAYAADAEGSWIYYPGLGFNILKPITKYWVISRNIAYLAMIIIIIIVAFLVAFRRSFGGQTQVTIANSIPNIILALVMITISYPLSGLAIDLITIGSNVVQQILVQNEFSPGYKSLWESPDFNSSLFGLDASVNAPGLPDEITIKSESTPKYNLQPDDNAMSVWQAFGTAGVNVVTLPDSESGKYILTVIPNTGFLGSITSNLLGGLIKTGVVTSIVQLIFVIAALMTSVKLFFKLIVKYLVLVVYPAISPFIMLTIAIPGRGMATISSYFRTLLSASLSFVAIYAIFLFISVLTRDNDLAHSMSFAPPLLGFEGTIDSQFLGSLIQMILGFALFITTPAIPDMLDSWLNVIPEYAKQATPVQMARTQYGAGYRSGVSGFGRIAGTLTGKRGILGGEKK